MIEDCEVSGSSCDGITLGKFGDEYDNAGPFTRCYYNTIMRAASNGWERVGHHVVRRCKVSECGQTGIHGSLGAAASQCSSIRHFPHRQSARPNWENDFCHGWDALGVANLHGT